MLEVIRNLILDFVLYFVTPYMIKWPIHVTSAQSTTQIHDTSFEEVSKKYFYDKQFTTITTHNTCSKLL